jgi:hypothetical protein
MSVLVGAMACSSDSECNFVYAMLCMTTTCYVLGLQDTELQAALLSFHLSLFGDIKGLLQPKVCYYFAKSTICLLDVPY